MKPYFFSFLVLVFIGAACTVDDNPTKEPDPEGATRTYARCESGYAKDFPCLGFDLLSRISIKDFDSSRGNDSWGWTDPETGKEYALMCLDDGTAFVDISDPQNPVNLGKLFTATSTSMWRDVKVYQNHAYIVSEANRHGLQVFDLTRLRGLTEKQNFEPDAHITTFGRAHNIAIDEDSGFAYVIGSTRFKGGPLIFDLQNPKDPKEIGGYADAGYSHDAHIVLYNGPMDKYKNKQIFVGSNASKVVILDVTDKENIYEIANIDYANVSYTHQGWFSEDHRYFFVGDETDEQQTGTETRIIAFDFTDLENPSVHHIFKGPTKAIDHNLYIKDNHIYLANYRAGLRKMDISQIADKKIEEVAFFDSYPKGDNSANFGGAWSTYPFFESGTIVISDMDFGMILVKSQ